MPEISLEVTGLQTSETEPETVEEIPAPVPEVVVIEKQPIIVEEIPEGNSQWQNDLTNMLQGSLASHQNQTLEILSTIQSFRETVEKILLLLSQQQKAPLTQIPPVSQPENLPEPAPEVTVIEPEKAIPETTEAEKEKANRKRRQRI